VVLRGHEGDPHAPGLAGIAQGPFFFGPPARARSTFGWYHAPAGHDGGGPQTAGHVGGSPQTPGDVRRGGVLLCNPIGDDAVRAHRPLRHLAERLAHAGFAVLRFDFHGTGDSLGDEREQGRVAAWLDDVRAALAELRARCHLGGDPGAPAGPISIVGLRLGATLALCAADLVDGVVLWGPYARGAAFHTESTRLYKMHRMLEPQSFSGGPKTRPDGEEAFGFLLTHDTVAGLKALDTRAIARAPARRALVVGDGSGAPAEQEIVDHLGSLGVAAERRVFPGSRQFLIEVPHKSRLPEDALDAMVGWLGEGHPASAAAPGPSPARASEDGDLAERPVFFGPRGALFGILHEPVLGTAGRALPPIVLTSAGTVHRIGPHRFYVTLARRWAALGFPVLRVDLTGIGDSAPGADGIENVTYPRDGYADLEDAVTFMGAPRVILAGLCSGGDFAFQMGMRDPRVRSVLILNPRTFCVNDLAAVETGNNASVLAAASGVRDVDGEVVPVPESLRRMVGSGVDTLLVVTEKDPGVDYVDTHWGEAMAALAGLPGFRREDVAGADHNFTSLWSQEKVADLCTEHLTRRYLT
jgi:alpha-beta hydrolase superfamily lysophospholipase